MSLNVGSQDVTKKTKSLPLLRFLLQLGGAGFLWYQVGSFSPLVGTQ